MVSTDVENGVSAAPASAREEVAADEGAPRSRMSPRARAILLTLLLAAVIATAIWFVRYQTHGKYLKETDDAQVAARR